MKKAITAGLLAICWIALSQQQASAWVNSRFGIGLNWDFSSGGNSLGWGLIRGGQPPGPEVFGGGYGGGRGGMPNNGMPYGGSFNPGVQIGNDPAQDRGFGYAPAPQGVIDTTTVAPPYAGSPMYYSGPYQFANNPRPIYYYPNTWYGGR